MKILKDFIKENRLKSVWIKLKNEKVILYNFRSFEDYSKITEELAIIDSQGIEIDIAHIKNENRITLDTNTHFIFSNEKIKEIPLKIYSKIANVKRIGSDGYMKEIFDNAISYLS